MSLTKKARLELAETLRKHHSEVDLQINKNKREFRRLEEKQAVLKRKRAEIHKVIRALSE